jgi:hypothetical protein
VFGSRIAGTIFRHDLVSRSPFLLSITALAALNANYGRRCILMDEELPPSPGTATHTPPEADEIARLAYQFYEEEGRPEGRAEEHWRRAEQTLLGIAPPWTIESDAGDA